MPVVGHTHLQTRKETSPIVEESFGIQNIRIHPIVFELHAMEKKEEEEERRRRRKKKKEKKEGKEEEERRRRRRRRRRRKKKKKEDRQN